MKGISVLITSFCLLTLISCGSNSAKAQVLTGTKDITIERLNEIVDKIIYGLSSKDKIYSQEFGTVLKENDTPPVTHGNADNLSLPGELFLDETIVSMGIGGEEMTEKAKRQYKLISCSEKEAFVQVILDEEFAEGGKLHDENCKLCLVKEKGVWVVDDVFYGDSEFYNDPENGTKYWIKKEITESITVYNGHLLDEFEPRPFTMYVAIDKYPDKNGVRNVWGAFKFDSKKEDDWSFISDGTLQDGKVSFMVNEYGVGDHCFSWETNTKGKEVRGEWQAYNPGGMLAMSSDFVMTIRQ